MQRITTFFTNIYEYFFDETAEYYIMNGNAKKAVIKIDDNFKSFDCLKNCTSQTFNNIIDLLYENHRTKILTKIFIKFISTGGLSQKNKELYRRTIYILKKRPIDWNKYTDCPICTDGYSPDIANHINCNYIWMNKLQHTNLNYTHHIYLPLIVMIGMKYLNKSTIWYPLHFNRDTKKICKKYNMYIISLGKHNNYNNGNGFIFISEQTQRKLEKIYL
jgi:hypothetical protein